MGNEQNDEEQELGGRWKSIGFLLPGGLFNIAAFLRLYSAFENPDTNHDGAITISDLGVHSKEIFFRTGDLLTQEIAATGFGAFFEMNINEPAPALSFLISAILWFMLYLGLKILITGEEI